jgi:hypothetical protein
MWILTGGAGAAVLALVVVATVLIVRSKASPEAPGALRQAKDVVDCMVPAPLRMGVMIVTTTLLLLSIWWLAHQQLAVIAYKAALITMAAVIGYWADRTAFPHSRPHVFPDPEVRWRYEIRRAYVICAAMLTSGLGA